MVEKENLTEDTPAGRTNSFTLAKGLERAGVKILGLLQSIDMAEDRDRFKELVDKIGLNSPAAE